MSNFTFKCEICKKERSFEDIDVYTERMYFEFTLTAIDRNINYCRDNPECKKGAALIGKEFRNQPGIVSLDFCPAGYADVVEKVKVAAKLKKEAKETAIKSQGAEELVADIKDLSTEKKEKQLSLFDYLLEFNKKTGKTEIVDNTGQKHDIIIGAKIKI